MQFIKVSELKPHPQNDKYFDDITGGKWEDLLQSIKRRGVIEPIVITEDKIIVSGHQRVRACKELNIDTILCEVRLYDDDDKSSKEDKILEDLISTNLMQRGIGNTNPIKLARCIETLERIKGVKHGNNQHSRGDDNLSHPQTLQITQEDIAKQLGMTLRQLQRSKEVLKLPEPIQDLMEKGQLDNKTLAKKISKELTSEEMDDFVSYLVDTGYIKVTSEIFESYRRSIEDSSKNILKEKDAQLQKQEEQITKLTRDKRELETKKNEAIRKGKQEVVNKIQHEIDGLNEQLKEKDAEIKLLNKYNLTKEEIDLANIKYEQSSQAITTAVEVEFEVQKIIGEISKLKISDLYADSNEVVYRNKVLTILYKAQDEINRMISELQPDQNIKVYNNLDIIEEVQYHD